MARHAATRDRRRPSGALIAGGFVFAGLLAGVGVFIALDGSAGSPHAAHGLAAAGHRLVRDGTAGATTPATADPSTAPATTSTLPPPGPGFVAGQVTAVGDSVMLDYQGPLTTDIPGINVQAAVSRQWAEGESILQDMKAAGQLGAEIIVGLGTNGPISGVDFDNMMSILGGASRVVFVNVHVDRPWQDPNNAVLAQGATRYHNVVVADWATLAAQNPEWFGADGTHLAIDGPGADALASLISTTLARG
jgi:hypothetical protein